MLLAMLEWPLQLAWTNAPTTVRSSAAAGLGVGVGNGVLGGDEAGVLNSGPVVIFSRKWSSWRRDNALCNVSSGRIGGTPPNPDGEAVLGIISRKFGADELPLMTAVLNKLFVLVAIFFAEST